MKKYQPYLLTGGLVTIFFVAIAILYQFTPFGSSTMLTVDLGQQYIDFYSLFKETLTRSPEMFFYSFEKALGGEMLGLWAYYLLSPFNLILLFFDESNFHIAVTLLTYLKILSASLSFAYFGKAIYKLEDIPTVIFSISYAFMSYVIVYQLNIMWLDGLILLPLIAVGLHRVVNHQGGRLYTLSLALMLAANYYIGYMICIFLAMYAVYVIIENQAAPKWKDSIINYLRFVGHSLVAVLISAITLLPTYYSISHSKGEYLKFEWDWDVVHTIQDIASKLFVGSFNFDEMSSGSPNIYAGTLVTLLVVAYFFNRRIKWQEKLTIIGIFTVFILSFRYDLFNKLWHGGQFPIWYHFRFSFVTSFLMIVMAIKSFTLANNDSRMTSLAKSLLMISVMTLFCGYYLWANAYEFLDVLKILVTLGFALALIITLQLKQVNHIWRYLALLVIVSIELFTNAILILDNINYVKASKFEDYTETLSESLSGFTHSDDEFYRTYKTFMRTKNEAMYTHYDGLDHFGSTIEAKIPELYGYLGQPDGNGFAVYTNGTLFLDDFFGIKYFLTPSEDSATNTSDEAYVLYPEATDLDMNFHQLVKKDSRVNVYENEHYFGLGIEVSPDIIDASFVSHQPIKNQELLLSLIDFKGNGAPYFTKRQMGEVTYENIEVTDKGDGDYYTYSDTTQSDGDKPIMYWHFETTSTNPYYFTIPSQYSSKNVKMRLNGDNFRFYSPFRRRQVYNASFNNVASDQVLEVELKEEELKANLIDLYEFDLPRYEQMVKETQNNGLVVDSFSHNRIKGHVTTQQDSGYILLTIPYEEGWQITVDGHSVKPVSVLSNTLMAIPVNSAGKHTIELHYFPRVIWYGAGLTLIGIASFILVGRIKPKRTTLSDK